MTRSTRPRHQSWSFLACPRVARGIPAEAVAESHRHLARLSHTWHSGLWVAPLHRPFRLCLLEPRGWPAGAADPRGGTEAGGREATRPRWGREADGEEHTPRAPKSGAIAKSHPNALQGADRHAHARMSREERGGVVAIVATALDNGSWSPVFLPFQPVNERNRQRTDRVSAVRYQQRSKKPWGLGWQDRLEHKRVSAFGSENKKTCREAAAHGEEMHGEARCRNKTACQKCTQR